jgi:hypothetical protein
MPYSAGPNIAARPNLVFEYDLGDVQNSYKGEPTTNLYPYSEQVNQWGNSNCVVTANAAIAPNGTTTADFLKADGVATYHTVYQVISTTSGLTYTFSCYVQPAGGFNGNTNTFFMQTNDGSWKNITFNLTNLTYSATAGTSGFVQQLQGGWYRVGWTVTIATGGSLYWYIYPTSSPSAETLGGGYYVWGAQLEQKDHATQYLQTPSNTSATRSNTQGLLDISGQNNTVNLSSVSFTSAAQPTFDGTDDNIALSSSLGNLGPNNWTIGCWWKANGAQSSYTSIISQGFTGGIASGGWAFKVKNASNQNVFSFSYASAFETINDITTSAACNDGNWHNLVVTRQTTTCTMYMDGVSVGTFSVGSVFNFGTGATTYIGYTPRDAAYLKGTLSNFFIYNIALTAAEVLRNYNQLKGRFNLI